MSSPRIRLVGVFAALTLATLGLALPHQHAEQGNSSADRLGVAPYDGAVRAVAISPDRLDGPRKAVERVVVVSAAALVRAARTPSVAIDDTPPPALAIRATSPSLGRAPPAA